MRDRDDVAGFIAGFAGDDRYIVDYLAEEVLARQPDEVHQFLLSTSILDRLSAPLCDAVTGRDDGKAMLALLERGNLFLSQLDDRRSWYRYHQLFADVLHAHLLDERPQDVAGLHQRASEWYAATRLPAEAIRHALVARDFDRAADLAEPALPALLSERREAEVRGWLREFPAEVVAVRPVLNIGFVGSLMSVTSSRGSRSGWTRSRGRWPRRRRRAGRRRRGPVPDPAGDGRALQVGLALVRGGRGRHGRPRPAGRRPGRGRGPHVPGRCVGADGAGLVGEGDLDAAHGPTSRAWPDWSGPAGSPTSSAARSPWRTSGPTRAS